MPMSGQPKSNPYVYSNPKPFPNPRMGQMGDAPPLAMDYAPEELERMLAQGWTVLDDGGMVPPANPAPMMPDLMGAPSEPAPDSVFSDPMYAKYMSIVNPTPEATDPVTQMMKRVGKNPLDKEPKPGVNLSVPGGASIVGGMPMAAKSPTPDYAQPEDESTGNPYAGRIGRRMTQRSMPAKKGRTR